MVVQRSHHTSDYTTGTYQNTGTRHVLITKMTRMISVAETSTNYTMPAASISHPWSLPAVSRRSHFEQSCMEQLPGIGTYMYMNSTCCLPEKFKISPSNDEVGLYDELGLGLEPSSNQSSFILLICHCQSVRPSLTPSYLMTRMTRRLSTCAHLNGKATKFHAGLRLLK